MSKTLLLAFALTVVASAAHAQTLIDRVLVRVNGDIVTLSDVRQARLLKLVPAAAGTDDAIADAIVSRRLMLVEIARYSTSEPAPDALAQRRKEWESSLGTGANVSDLLRRGGMTDAMISTWLRDDLRIQAYLDRRFPQSTIPRRDALLKYYQDHLPEFTQNGEVIPFDTAEPKVREKVAGETRAKQIAQWIDGLKSRADITYIKS